jgi:hypothetical protein
MDKAVFATLARSLGHFRTQFLADITRHETGIGGRAPWPSLDVL